MAARSGAATPTRSSTRCTSRASPCATRGAAELRGTYAGLGHEAAIGYLTDLGVTAVELLPVHQNVPESFLPQRGLTNYWGYNTIGYFAPHNGYSAAVRAGRPGGQVAEFKAMVDALHAAGLEVILDVVFNHSAEADQMGPTLCFRGLDNPAYYRLDPADPSRYIDTTGCGNSLNAGDTLTLQLIMDSLRYWLTEMHVDGFRFDLAPSWPARRAGSTRCRPSSTSSRRTRWCRRPSSSPSRGTWARWTPTTSAGSRRCGGSGTASTAMPCATSGAATRSGSASSPPGSAARPTSTAARAGAAPPPR